MYYRTYLKNGSVLLLRKMLSNLFCYTRHCLIWIWLNPWKMLFSLGFALILFNEWLSYALLPLQWPKLKCGRTDSCLKLLLVADPQILGEMRETWLERWDSDRYLHRTFSVAKSYSEPDLIIFLGDLMDEGSTATHSEYKRYLSRFEKIFKLPVLQSNQTIFIAGDNDIGGENEPITKLKVERFIKNFGVVSEVSLKNVEFFHVNKMLRTYPDVVREKKENWLRLALSHIPLLGVPGLFSQKAISEIKPDFIFSAHDHKSAHLVGDIRTGEQVFFQPLISNKFANYHPSWIFFPPSRNMVNEVVIPTCSYRMGTKIMAYGVANLDVKRNVMHYSLLLLPPRLSHILLYSIYSIICLIFIILQLVLSFISKSNVIYSKIRKVPI